MTTKESLDRIQAVVTLTVKLLSEPRKLGCITWWQALDAQLKELERLHHVHPES